MTVYLFTVLDITAHPVFEWNKKYNTESQNLNVETKKQFRMSPLAAPAREEMPKVHKIQNGSM